MKTNNKPKINLYIAEHNECVGSIQMVNDGIITTSICNPPITDGVFDLIPGKHGHFLNREHKIEEATGVRMIIPYLDISCMTLYLMAEFIDGASNTEDHTDFTIAIKKGDGDIPAKMGIFTI